MAREGKLPPTWVDGSLGDTSGWAKPNEIELPPSYIGQVATRCKIPDSKNSSGGSPAMCRWTHQARDLIVNPQIVIPNWYGSGESTTGGTMTVTASIEYPAGVFTQATFIGSTSGTIADGTNGITDQIPVTIPFGATFWSRMFITRADGQLLWSANEDSITGDGFVFGAGATDMTMGGTVTQSTSSNFCPAAIVAATRRPSVCLVGDSRVAGMGGANGMTPNTAGDKGELAPTIGEVFGYIKLAIGGEQGANFVTNHSKRVALSAYCSHVICDYGINDLGGGASAAAVQTTLATIAGYFTGKPFYLCTLPPVTTSTDAWATTANQTPSSYNANRITVNQAIRKNQIARVKSFFDIASAVETDYNSGFWKPNFTSDGTHENILGGLAIVAANAINPAKFTRG